MEVKEMDVNAMAEKEVKRIEQRCRRALAREGYALRKGKDGWGAPGYRIINPYFNRIEAGEKFDLGLDDVVSWCEDQ